MNERNEGAQPKQIRCLDSACFVNLQNRCLAPHKAEFNDGSDVCLYGLRIRQQSKGAK